MTSHFNLKLLPLLLAAALVATPALSHAEDLMEAYQQARLSDPVLAQADAQRLQAAAGVGVSRAALLPTLSAGVDFTQAHGNHDTLIDPSTGEVIELGHTRSNSLTARLSQTLFNYSDYANLAASRSSAQAQAAQYQAAQQNLLVRVAQAYFNVLTAEDDVSFAEAQEKALDRQLDQAQQRYKVGLSAITDVNEAKAQYDAARANTITSKNTLADLREGLSQITGKPLGTLEKLRDDLPLTPPSPNSGKPWVDMALQQNPTILAQQYTVQASKHDIHAARANHLPTLAATVSYSRTPSWTHFGNQHSRNENTAVGISLSVPIFNGGLTHARVKQSIYQRDAALDVLEQQRRQIIRGTRNAFRLVVAGISEVDARKQAVLSAKSALDATQAGFEVGTRNIIDVLNSQQQLFQARNNYSLARHNFIINKLLLKQSAGSIDVKDLQAVNALLVAE
ncbi:MAG: TolC family outer membrane protein [Xanthomonadales bacterium]|nr:TolC family outer membrane protein [Xanthomonadales bacterium]